MANTSPKTNGMSASENECRLRRKCRCTTQASAATQPSAIAHHARCGSASGGSPRRNAKYSPAATAAKTRPYSVIAGTGDRRGSVIVRERIRVSPRA